MNAQSIRNILILAVILAACVFGVLQFWKKQNEPQKMAESSSFESLGEWYKTNEQLIGKGQAVSALSNVETKLQMHANTGDPGIKYHLFELQGDALLSLKRCREAQESFNKSLSSLGSAQFAYVPERAEELMTPDQRKENETRLGGKLSKAVACAGGK
jgi:predicted negative regulator of RcsB-dependent stress response